MQGKALPSLRFGFCPAKALTSFAGFSKFSKPSIQIICLILFYLLAEQKILNEINWIPTLETQIV